MTKDKSFIPSDKFHLTIEGKEGAEIPLDESNLITKSYRLFQSMMKSVPTEYAIHLKKIIPIGSGLGGGSSNAAAVLRALNKLWKMNFSPNKLEELGAELGADIPFFIRGGFQLAEGVGEKLTPQDNQILHGLHFLLIIPSVRISTPDAYHSLNNPVITTINRNLGTCCF